MRTLRGMVAVVTGASGGIGEAISVALAREGVKLLLAGRNEERLDLVAERARDLSPGVETFAGDLSEDGPIQALADRAQKAFGGVSILIHSIGLFLAGPI